MPSKDSPIEIDVARDSDRIMRAVNRAVKAAAGTPARPKRSQKRTLARRSPAKPPPRSKPPRRAA